MSSELPGTLCGDGEWGWNPCSLGWLCPRRDLVSFRKELSEKRTAVSHGRKEGEDWEAAQTAGWGRTRWRSLFSPYPRATELRNRLLRDAGTDRGECGSVCFCLGEKSPPRRAEDTTHCLMLPSYRGT